MWEAIGQWNIRLRKGKIKVTVYGNAKYSFQSVVAANLTKSIWSLRDLLHGRRTFTPQFREKSYGIKKSYMENCCRSNYRFVNGQ